MIPDLIAYLHVGLEDSGMSQYIAIRYRYQNQSSGCADISNLYMMSRQPYPINFCSNTYEDQVKYIEEKFASLNSNPNKTVYIHETCATDTNQIQLILDNVIDALLQKILHGYGLC
uniref:Uncharacterized protein n=1 Tax=Meloidogyne javanica TaxID=6303 RepID=A0A915LLR6_MELJA